MFLDGKTFTCCAFGVNINSSIEHHFVSMLGVCLEKMGTASKKKSWGFSEVFLTQNALNIRCLVTYFFPLW